MNIQEKNFGLAGMSSFMDYDNRYDYLFDKWKAKRAEKKEMKQDRKDDRKQRKDDRKAERQEKRELSSDKKRLKNEMRQTQIDERKSQLSLLNQQAQQPLPAAMPAAGDNSTMIIAGVVGVLAIAGVGYFMFNKNKNAAASPFQKAA
jgi:hypothetical protein